MPLASIIVTNLNGLTMLGTCLSALRCQTFKDFEVIVVDDCSIDQSVEWTRQNFPEAQIVRMERTSGMAVACNRGAKMARGEILIMLNNDTEVEPEWLAEVVSAMDNNPHAGAIASKMLLFDRRDTLHTSGDLMGKDGIPRNRGVWEIDTGQYDASAQVFNACGGSAAYRRAAWEQTGGFDEDLFMYMEDVDLAWRLRLAGWQVVFAPRARVYHRLSATGGGVLASYYTGRNTILVIAKDFPGRLLAKYWPRIVRAQLAVAADAARAWRGEAARARLRGQGAGLVNIHKWIRKRGHIRAATPAALADIERLLVD